MAIVSKIPAQWTARQRDMRRWRCTDTVSGNIIFIGSDDLGSIVFNSTLTAATLYLNFAVPSQGSNTTPAVLEVDAADVADVAAFMEAAWIVSFDVAPAT